MFDFDSKTVIKQTSWRGHPAPHANLGEITSASPLRTWRIDTGPMVGSDDVQVAWLVTSCVLPSDRVAVAVSCEVLPSGSDKVPLSATCATVTLPPPAAADGPVGLFEQPMTRAARVRATPQRTISCRMISTSVVPRVVRPYPGDARTACQMRSGPKSPHLDVKPQRAGGRLTSTMERSAFAILVVLASSQLAAQTPDRTLQRVSLALERPPSGLSGTGGDTMRMVERQVLGTSVYEPVTGAPKLGPFEFVAPQLRGEFIRLALPVGKYLSQGMRGLAAANRRRQEQAARRRVEADIKAWREAFEK